MTKIVQIRVGTYRTGVVGLEEAMRYVKGQCQNWPDQKIGTIMMEKLSKKNYIPSTVATLYEAAFLREYKKFIGEPVPKIPVNGIEIKVLGAGCPTCDRLEQDLMGVIEELGVQADLEHIRDIKKISQYKVMGVPAIVINDKVKMVGSVPSRAQLKELILKVQTDLKQ
ncbi:MAG: thioredoxin family protein [Desulfobacteraceae bacterium]|nr:thioredoxin family protein [Desulfobacteraceae bacterium]